MSHPFPTDAHPLSRDVVVTEQPGAPDQAAPDSLSYGDTFRDPSADPPARSHRPRLGVLTRRLVPRTLVARLAAGVVALVIAVVAASGAATYYALHSFLTNRLDQQLAQTADLGSLNQLFRTRDVGAPPPRLRDPQHEVFVIGRLPDGATVDPPAGTGVTAMRLSNAQAARLAAQPQRPVTLSTTDGHRLRIVAVPLPSLNATTPQGAFGVVIVGLSTADIEDTLHRLLLLELAIGGGAVLIALIISTTGLRLGLGPLRRVTRTAREVTTELSPSGGGLDRRVPTSDSTTEVGQLATSFNTMLDRVEREFAARRESEERMRRFLADASHELRTPLTSIRGYAELARLQAAKGGATGGDDTIGRIETEGTRMSRLVEDLMLLARGDDDAERTAEALPREAVAVDGLVDEVVAGLRAAHPQRQIRTDVPVGLSVVADRDQILRVLRNLATNAAVHTDPGGIIGIAAEGRPDGHAVALRIADQGPGLDPQDAAHVFERFWRADTARTRVRGGSGLGLAIVAQIVGAHGGTVRFDSSVERGSTVTVILPSG